MRRDHAPSLLGKAEEAIDRRALRELRLEAKLSLTQMGQLLGLEAFAVGELERGHRAWTAELLERYQSACWIAISDA